MYFILLQFYTDFGYIESMMMTTVPLRRT